MATGFRVERRNIKLTKRSNLRKRSPSTKFLSGNLSSNGILSTSKTFLSLHMRALKSVAKKN